MQQNPLPLTWPEDRAAHNFLLSPANAEAVRHLDQPERWPVPVSLLTGPRRSGRTLLARRFAAITGGAVLDDAQGKPEALLFHAWNMAKEAGHRLLIVADAAPPGWAIALPDLRSRLAATPRVAIGEPDDALMAGLLERGLAARGFAVPPALVGWLVRRLPRDYLGVERAVDLLDAAALAEARPLGVSLARDALRPLLVDDGDAME